MAVVRTTFAIPSDLLEQVDRAVLEGTEKSRNSFITAALKRESAERERATIDAAFAGMAEYVGHRADAVRTIDAFAISDWEAFAECGQDR